MSNFNDIVAGSLNEVLEFLGEPLIVGNKTVKAVVNNIQFEDDLMDGGILKKRGITAVIATMTGLPAIGGQVIFKGRAFRILEINEDSAGIELVCETNAK